jgi:hypothetical protein
MRLAGDYWHESAAAARSCPWRRMAAWNWRSKPPRRHRRRQPTPHRAGKCVPACSLSPGEFQNLAEDVAALSKSLAGCDVQFEVADIHQDETGDGFESGQRGVGQDQRRLAAVKPNHERFGFTRKQWTAFVAEAREILIEVAGQRRMITYGELAGRMTTLHVEPHDMVLWEIIGDVSRGEEHEGVSPRKMTKRG